MPAPAAMIEDDEDALIPIESDFGDPGDDLDADLLAETPGDLAVESLEVDPDATTQPELAASAPSNERPAAPIRANEVDSPRRTSRRSTRAISTRWTRTIPCSTPRAPTCPRATPSRETDPRP